MFAYNIGMAASVAAGPLPLALFYDSLGQEGMVWLFAGSYAALPRFSPWPSAQTMNTHERATRPNSKKRTWSRHRQHEAPQDRWLGSKE